MLQLDFFDQSDAYIAVKTIIIINERNNRDKKFRSIALTNNATFINYITTSNNVLIENKEDFYVVMAMSNLIEYSKYYRKATDIFVKLIQR